jgi:hypothetical protein
MSRPRVLDGPTGVGGRGGRVWCGTPRPPWLLPPRPRVLDEPVGGERMPSALIRSRSRWLIIQASLPVISSMGPPTPCLSLLCTLSPASDPKDIWHPTKSQTKGFEEAGAVMEGGDEGLGTATERDSEGLGAGVWGATGAAGAVD